MNLTKETLVLKEFIEQLKERYEKNEPPENINNKAFFLNMKKETTIFYETIEAWENGALSFVKDKTVNVHPHQIISTRENFELLILHSYYVDVKRKRYMELNHSCHFIFDQLINALELKTLKSEG